MFDSVFFFFFIDTATTEIYTLSLHDALPISGLELALVQRDHLAGALRHRGRAARRVGDGGELAEDLPRDRKSTRLNSSHVEISYAVFCLKKKKKMYKILFTQHPQHPHHTHDY